MIGLITLLICHYIAGRGLISLFKLKLRPIITLPLSMICGVALASFVPFFMELLHITFTAGSMTAGMAILTAIFLVPLILDRKNIYIPKLSDIKMTPIYEWPFYIVFGLLLFVSVWRCYYYPPNARDMLSGPEVMAEYTLKEHHMINSVFTVDLQSTNNYLKPPYITSLQIIYKYFVQPIGQVWLSVLVLSFLLIMFTLMKEKLHAVIAYFIMVFFISMPELFGYTYLMLFDYSNMIFLFLGFWFIARYIDGKQANDFYFSIFLFSIATYVRTETLILVGMVVPLAILYFIREKLPAAKQVIRLALFLGAPFVVYFLCMNVFVKHYIPVHYDVSSDVNKNLSDLSQFTGRMYDIYDKLMTGENSVFYYGKFFPLFFVIVVVDVFYVFAVKRSSSLYDRQAIVGLYGTLVVFVGLAFIGYLLPLADLMHTTKRGLFKMFPLMLLYMANSPSLVKLTSIIRNWELGTPSKPSVKPPAKAQPAVANNRKK